FASLAEVLVADADGVVRVACEADVRVFGADGVLAIGVTKPLAVVGIDGAVVVETADAVLVTTRSSAQRVKDAATEPSATPS
ncbi:MAG: mannose-1-phosphate guanylyltransferase, partial [Actinomycetota bacterium]